MKTSMRFAHVAALMLAAPHILCTASGGSEPQVRSCATEIPTYTVRFSGSGPDWKVLNGTLSGAAGQHMELSNQSQAPVGYVKSVSTTTRADGRAEPPVYELDEAKSGFTLGILILEGGLSAKFFFTATAVSGADTFKVSGSTYSQPRITNVHYEPTVELNDGHGTIELQHGKNKLTLGIEPGPAMC